ncbi:DUF3810 domain-containing protein [Proteinivorax hydrogeniformans]|uniref:DUF3810 domain-containing protein n=1 Tax=Proteinivorax hydrogeniformans TaxID=1826727 RepID=A0AAU8HQP2_9FIRM
MESIYSTRIYKRFAQVLSLITGVIPISVAEILIICFIGFIIFKLVSRIIALKKEPQNRLDILLKCGATLLAALSIIYFSFIAVWGLNYHRQDFASIADYDVHEYSTQDLSQLAEHLILQANYLRNYIEEDELGIMTLPDGKSDVMRRAHKGFDNAAEVYPQLGGKYGKPKMVLMSNVMSHLGIWGAYFPFTAEANVNISIPESMIPSITLHEMAHQRGFAREDEADYIAYLTAVMHPDYDFQYSGTLLALRHTMSALSRADFETFQVLANSYSDGLARDMEHINMHNRSYQGRASQVSAQINNTYLRANAQQDGIKSYGRMIDLMMASFLQELEEL